MQLCVNVCVFVQSRSIIDRESSYFKNNVCSIPGSLKSTFHCVFHVCLSFLAGFKLMWPVTCSLILVCILSDADDKGLR